MGWYIVIGTIPALVIGYFLRNVVEALFQRPLFEAAMRMLAAAALMTAAELFSRRSRNLSVLGRLDALIIGCFQVLAVFPGASRSGSTISGAMLRNFDRPTAARFSFFLSAPIMVAAGGYETYKVLKMPGLGHLIPAFALGFVVAGIVGWLSIKWLLAYLNKHSLYVFSAYCTIAAVICLAFTFLH
jgi:undecaprenyl-diphosphatase